MSWWFCLILFIGVLLEWKLTHSATAEIGKTKDKGRAYEFGFSIEEQQHRHEKKDENGIVMGEFGFITADGIYHVTVYATDENGKFKIISMKNYPYGNPERKIMIAMLPPPKKAEATPTVVKAMMPDGKSCGGCVVPKKLNQLPADVMAKKPDDEKAVFRPLSKALNDVSANGKTNGGARQSNSLSKTTSGTPLQGGGANGKRPSASQQPSLPGSKPLVPPEISAPGALKPKTIGATSSKVEPKSPENNGNRYQLTNFLTQTTQTPTQIPGIRTPKRFGQSSRENDLSFETESKLFKFPNQDNQFKPLTTNGNYQTIYNSASFTTKNPIKSFGLPSYNTNTTPQHFLNSQTKTNPTRTSTQLSKNKENKIIAPKNTHKMSYQFGFSGLTNQITPTSFGNKKNIPQVGGSLQTTKFPNPFHTSEFPSDVPAIYNTKTKSPSSSVSLLNNPTRSFEIPASNRKTPSQQQGSINPFTQNAVKPILKSTKEQKPFQTLSKILPDPDGSIPSGTPQTSTLTSNPRNTALQKPGQGPSLVTSTKPQQIGKNTLTQQTLTPKRLLQSTNGAKTSTTNTQSTNKQTPVAPSSQSVGKTTPPNNAGGGVGGASRSGNAAAAAAGGGGGPLYRFKYVLDYNSHREEGRIDGSKEGKYNTLNDDGIRRIIDYIANENGYQPHIRLERPPPNELPTGENKLKEYEFVWFN